jgi:hypothetical protein
MRLMIAVKSDVPNGTYSSPTTVPPAASTAGMAAATEPVPQM